MTEQYAPSWFDVRDEAQHVTVWTADELDRMIDQVRAEAWDQGFDVGYEDQRNRDTGVPMPRNPYREEQ